jgi:hypothetical protein
MATAAQAVPGHNQPPAFEAHSLHIEDLFDLVSDSTSGGAVENDEQDAALDGLLDEFRKARKAADAERVAEKKPHDDAAAAVQTKWKPLLARCDAAADEIKRLLTPYRTAKQRAKDDAALKAREEAEAAQKAAQEALQATPDLATRFAAEEDLKRAQKLTATANKIDRAATGLRTFWVAEITDRRAALNHYLKRQPEAFETLIQSLADHDARNGRPPVAGVLFHERKKAA